MFNQTIHLVVLLPMPVTFPFIQEFNFFYTTTIFEQTDLIDVNFNNSFFGFIIKIFRFPTEVYLADVLKLNLKLEVRNIFMLRSVWDADRDSGLSIRLSRLFSFVEHASTTLSLSSTRHQWAFRPHTRHDIHISKGQK